MLKLFRALYTIAIFLKRLNFAWSSYAVGLHLYEQIYSRFQVKNILKFLSLTFCKIYDYLSFFKVTHLSLNSNVEIGTPNKTTLVMTKISIKAILYWTNSNKVNIMWGSKVGEIYSCRNNHAFCLRWILTE